MDYKKIGFIADIFHWEPFEVLKEIKDYGSVLDLGCGKTGWLSSKAGSIDLKC